MTNRTKNIGLGIGFFLILLMSYQFAIKKTIQIKEEYSNLITQQNLLKDAPRQLSILKKKETYYDSILARYQLKGSSMQNNLLMSVNAIAGQNNLKVISFMEPHTIEQNGLKVKIHQFSLEGDYNAIINLAHQLEQEAKFGEIINLHFERKKNFRTGKNYLQSRVLLKSYW